MIKHNVGCTNARLNYLHTGDTVCCECGCDMSNPVNKPIKTGGWRCAQCHVLLPRGGDVWRYRYSKWVNEHKDTSGYYCDDCADKRENGWDF
jgi:hypothetical protein